MDNHLVYVVCLNWWLLVICIRVAFNFVLADLLHGHDHYVGERNEVAQNRKDVMFQVRLETRLQSG